MGNNPALHLPRTFGNTIGSQALGTHPYPSQYLVHYQDYNKMEHTTVTDKLDTTVQDELTQSKPGFLSWARDLVETLVLALIIFTIVNTLTGRYEVQSISMEPTLHEGQYLIVSKMAYWLHSPERGDIVVLDPPNAQGGIPYIKRVIGLPGETVEIRAGWVLVDGIPLEEEYIMASPDYPMPATEIPEGEYFVLGDNRNSSNDSHNGWTVPRDNIIGKASFIYWPPSKLGVVKHYSYPDFYGVGEQAMMLSPAFGVQLE